MFANFLIGLREGLEAALIVSILITYLVKTGHRNQVSKIFVGTAAAVAVSVALGFTLSLVLDQLPPGTEELISGLISIASVVLVTWMIFWMAAQSRALSGQLRQKVDIAIERSAWALATVAFFSIVREGIETSVLIWSAARATTGNASSVLGAVFGLLAAAVLGVLLYRGALKINLGTFFKYTGAYLVLVAAGILAYGVGELQEIGVFNILTETTYSFTWLIPKDGAIDSLLRGLFGFKVQPTILETLAWSLYLIPTALIYLRGYVKPKVLVTA
ncbi:MAG: iron uptake transporter permease EfeU [Actinomycetes bacterium]